MGIDREPQVLFRGAGEVFEQRVGSLEPVSAGLANEVCVRLGRKLVRGRSVTEVGMDHYSDPLQLLQVPVDRGEVNVRSAGLNGLGHLLGAQMSLGREQRFENDPPRRGGSPAHRAEQGDHVLHGRDLGVYLVRWSEGLSHLGKDRSQGANEDSTYLRGTCK